MPLPLVRLDRANHFIYGSLIFAIVGTVLRMFGMRAPLARLVAMGVVVAVAIAKEIFDRWRNLVAQRAGLLPPHGVERADAAWTVFGGMVAWAASVGTED